MADGDGGVARLGLLHEQGGYGFAHNVAAAEDHTAPAARGDVVAAQQLEDAGRCGGEETGQAYGHLAYVDGMEAVHVLGGVYCLYDAVCVDVCRQGQLHDEAVHVSIGVEAPNVVEEFVLRDILIKAQYGRLKAYLRTGAGFGGHIGLAAAVVAHYHRHEMWGTASGGFQLLDAVLNLRTDGGCCGFSVYYRHSRG